MATTEEHQIGSSAGKDPRRAELTYGKVVKIAVPFIKTSRKELSLVAASAERQPSF